MHYKSEVGFQIFLPIYQTYCYLNARYFMYNGVTGNAKDFRKNPQILCKCLFRRLSNEQKILLKHNDSASILIRGQKCRENMTDSYCSFIYICSEIIYPSFFQMC